jgi:polyketide biosynthesis acyl carrier protein
LTTRDEYLSSRSDTELAVHRTILNILPAVRQQDLTPDKHLKDLGADSVDRVEIIMSLREQLSVAAPMSSFSGIPNIGVLVDVLHEAASR